MKKLMAAFVAVGALAVAGLATDAAANCTSKPSCDTDYLACRDAALKTGKSEPDAKTECAPKWKTCCPTAAKKKK